MRLMAELADEYGLSAGQYLAGTGLRQVHLSDPKTIVSGEQELRMIRNLVERLDDVPGLGIEAGARYHFTAFGVLGFALVSSRTPRGALDVALQYFPLTFCFTRFLVTDTDFETRVLVDDAELPDDVVRFVVERDITALLTVARDLYTLGPILRRLQLRSLPSARVTDYENWFGVKPLFGCDCNLVTLDRPRIERPLPQANELALHAALDQCSKLLEARKSRSGFASTVRERMIAGAARMPTMAQIAKGLCMTARTLRRRLEDEGTTFAELRDEVRLTLAEELLVGPQLSIEQIAERLGYAETTSFINAFKRWRGRTPHAFRLGRCAG